MLYEMSSNGEESMLSKEIEVPIDKYKEATKEQYHFLYIDKSNKSYKGNLMKPFNLILHNYIKLSI